jgi:hypothetical protein
MCEPFRKDRSLSCKGSVQGDCLLDRFKSLGKTTKAGKNNGPRVERESEIWYEFIWSIGNQFSTDAHGLLVHLECLLQPARIRKTDGEVVERESEIC